VLTMPEMGPREEGYGLTGYGGRRIIHMLLVR
jgi:hypothetical protein